LAPPNAAADRFASRCFLSTGCSRYSAPTFRTTPRTDSGRRCRILMTRAVGISPPPSVRRARIRSPTAGAGAASRAFRAARGGRRRRIRGGSPASSSHSAGVAISSPSVVRSVTARTETDGRSPARVSLPRFFSTVPSSARSFSIRFSAILSPPLMPKARPISRFPAAPG
jgi:hypothetical protein